VDVDDGYVGYTENVNNSEVNEVTGIDKVAKDFNKLGPSSLTLAINAWMDACICHQFFKVALDTLHI